MNTDSHKGAVVSTAAAIGLLILVVLIGVGVLVVLWPIKAWVFVPSASKMMQMYDDGEDADSIRKLVIDAMIKGGNTNQVRLKSKQNAFRAAVVLLVCEVVLLLLVLLLK